MGEINRERDERRETLVGREGKLFYVCERERARERERERDIQ